MTISWHVPEDNAITTVATARSSGGSSLVLADGSNFGTAGWPKLVVIRRGVPPDDVLVTVLEFTGRTSNTLTGVTASSGHADANINVSDLAFLGPTKLHITELQGNVDTAFATLATLASPAFTGTPTAPTATVGTNTTQLATTAFVLANAGSGGGTPGGANTSIQINNSGAFSGFGTWNGSVFSIGTTSTGTITCSGGSLTLSETGDTFGTVQLVLVNRVGMAGAIFKNLGLDLIDFGFITSSTTQSNLRYEVRGSNRYGTDNSTGEFQYIMDVGGTPYLSMIIGTGTVAIGGAGYLGSGAHDTNFGVGTANPLGRCHVIPNATTQAGVIIQGITSQSANLLEFWNSSSVTLATVDRLGATHLPTLADSAAQVGSLFLGSDHLDGASAPQLCTKDSSSNVTVHGSGSGSGTVTTVSIVTANGVSGTVATNTTTPAITLVLGAITPTSVVATGSVTGSNLSGTNTGDQTITLTGDITGTGVGSFATTIGATKVTNSMLAGSIAASKLVGSDITITESQVTSLTTDLADKAPLASPALTGTPTFAGSTSGTTILKASATASGTLTLPASTDTLATQTYVTSQGYITGNQTITISGDISGSGTTAITSAIGASKVTNTMLAGSIAASKLVGSDITITESQVTNLTTDLAAKAPLASPTLTGKATIPAHVAVITTENSGNFDCNVTDWHTRTLDGTNGTLTLTNDSTGQSFTIILTQDGTGSRTVTWWTTIKWPGGTVPTLTTTAGKTDVFTFKKLGAGSYLGFVAGQNL